MVEALYEVMSTHMEEWFWGPLQPGCDIIDWPWCRDD